MSAHEIRQVQSQLVVAVTSLYSAIPQPKVLHYANSSYYSVRGALKMHFRKKLGIWPNQQTPQPPPRKLGRQKKKKKFDVYFAF